MTIRYIGGLLFGLMVLTACNKEFVTPSDPSSVTQKDSTGTVLIPEAFSPNGDGKNDTWKITGPTITIFDLHIFNKMNDEVFSSSSIANAWDGNVNGKPMPDGTYYYTLGCTFANNSKETLKGHLILIR